MAVLQDSNVLCEDDDYDHLDFNRRDQLESFCRSRLNRVTGSLVHSHWSRNVEAWLSLVESFKAYSYLRHKEPAQGAIIELA